MPADALRLRALSKICGITITPGGGIAAWGDTPAGGTAVLTLPPPECADDAWLPSRRICVLQLSSRPRSAVAASLGALAVATAGGDEELFHVCSGRRLGRVFTAPSGGPWRRVQLAPAGSGAALGLLSVLHNSAGVRVLLHMPNNEGAACILNDGAACAGSASAAASSASADDADTLAPTRIRRAPWADGVLPLAQMHV
jgi:hypothetical protein